MDIIPLGPGFAAELRGLTLADVAADDAAYEAARAAFEDHSVLVFRGQQVTDEGQLAFSRRFGPLEVTKVGSRGEGGNLVILSTIDDSGKVVPAGEGDGHVAEILKDAYASGYRGFLSLEPHLAAAGQFSGFTGPNLFGVAVEALRKLAKENGIPLAS